MPTFYGEEHGYIVDALTKAAVRMKSVAWDCLEMCETSTTA